MWLNLGAVIQVSLLAVAMVAVLIRVVTAAEVNARTILGAISVYTVLGLLFGFTYEAIARVQGTPFFEGAPHIHHGDYLFFSYTTLTTTGLRRPRAGRAAGRDDRHLRDADRPDLPGDPGRRAGRRLAPGRRAEERRERRAATGADEPPSAAELVG